MMWNARIITLLMPSSHCNHPYGIIRSTFSRLFVWPFCTEGLSPKCRDSTNRRGLRWNVIRHWGTSGAKNVSDMFGHSKIDDDRWYDKSNSILSTSCFLVLNSIYTQLSRHRRNTYQNSSNGQPFTAVFSIERAGSNIFYYMASYFFNAIMTLKQIMGLILPLMKWSSRLDHWPALPAPHLGFLLSGVQCLPRLLGGWLGIWIQVISAYPPGIKHGYLVVAFRLGHLQVLATPLATPLQPWCSMLQVR